MFRKQTSGRLFLDGPDVGVVKVKGWDDSWGFGEFTPAEGFSDFAQRFGLWSLLMHEDDDATGDGRVSEATAEELRRAEYDIDRIHARLLLAGKGEWRKISQLNIDGPLIEWKEDFSEEGAAGAA